MLIGEREASLVLTSFTIDNPHMEKWPCPHCGEELLGAANRCWKCGERVRPPKLKPVETPVAEVAVAAPAMLMTVEEVALATAKPPPRRGSPFAIEAALADRPPHGTFYGDGPYREAKPRFADAPRLPEYPRNTSAVGGVTAALLLGGFSLVLLLFSVLGGVTALLGVGCAVWGLFSKRKGLAIFALILCCLALTLAGWKIGFVLYELLVVPLQAPPLAPPGA